MKKPLSVSLSYRLIGADGPLTDFIALDELPTQAVYKVPRPMTVIAIETSVVVRAWCHHELERSDELHVDLSVQTGFCAT